MALFKDVSEITNFLNIPEGNSIDLLKPFMDPVARKYLKPVIGGELLNVVDTYYNDAAPDPDQALDNLIPYLQRPLAFFLYFDSVHLMDVVPTDSGFAVVHNPNLAPASKDRVAAFKQSVEDMGYDAIEALYEFLEANESDYPDWVASDAYTRHYELFVNSALQFDRFVIIKKSRRKYLDLIPAMQRVELFDIIPVISEELTAEIKTQIKEGSLNAANARALTMIQASLCNLTMSEVVKADLENVPAYTKNAMASIAQRDKDGYNLAGTKYLSAVKVLLDNNVDDYPAYRDSDVYDLERETYDDYTNEEDSPIFVA